MQAGKLALFNIYSGTPGNDHVITTTTKTGVSASTITHATSSELGIPLPAAIEGTTVTYAISNPDPNNPDRVMVLATITDTHGGSDTLPI